VHPGVVGVVRLAEPRLVDAVSFDYSGGTLGCVSKVTRITVQ
jgi:hypothetical protein